MNAHGADIALEARLAIGACRCIQQPTRGAQDAAGERRRLSRRTRRRTGALRLVLALSFAFRALSADLRRRGQGINRASRYAHHLVCDAVRLML